MRLVEQTLAIVAYAEMRAIFLAWAGVRGWDPAPRVWCAVRQVLAEGGELVSIQARAQSVLRDESRMALESARRRAGPWPFDRTVAYGQIGSLDGLEESFHDAAMRASSHRADDPRLLALAVSLADFARQWPPRTKPCPNTRRPRATR
jgi:hypothetical protein